MDLLNTFRHNYYHIHFVRNALVIEMVFQFQWSHDDKHEVCDLHEAVARIFLRLSQLDGFSFRFFSDLLHTLSVPVVESRSDCYFIVFHLFQRL